MVNGWITHLVLRQTLLRGGQALLKLLHVHHHRDVLLGQGPLHLFGSLQLLAGGGLGGTCLDSGQLEGRDLGILGAQLLAVSILECRSLFCRPLQGADLTIRTISSAIWVASRALISALAPNFTELRWVVSGSELLDR